MKSQGNIVASHDLLRLDEVQGKVIVTVMEAAVNWQPETWGVVLFDLVHHLASAYAGETGLSYEYTAAQMLEAFDLERHDPMNQEKTEPVPTEYH